MFSTKLNPTTLYSADIIVSSVADSTRFAMNWSLMPLLHSRQLKLNLTTKKELEIGETSLRGSY